MRMALALVGVVVLTGCGVSASDQPTFSAHTATVSPSVSAQPIATTSAPPPSQGDAGFEPVTFSTNDGVAIEGRLFGEGDVAVVLAHGSFDSGQGSWVPYARTLAAEGYRVLTLNLRGYCPGGDV